MNRRDFLGSLCAAAIAPACEPVAPSAWCGMPAVLYTTIADRLLERVFADSLFPRAFPAPAVEGK